MVLLCLNRTLGLKKYSVSWSLPVFPIPSPIKFVFQTAIVLLQILSFSNISLNCNALSDLGLSWTHDLYRFSFPLAIY